MIKNKKPKNTLLNKSSSGSIVIYMRIKNPQIAGFWSTTEIVSW